MPNENQRDEDPRVFCFERPEEDREFEASVIELIATMQNRTRKAFVSEDNMLRLNHGSNWIHSARDPEPDTAMHTISAEWVVPFDGIAENDLGLIAKLIVPMNEDMERQFSQNFYRVVGEGAEKVGNVVDAKQAGSFAQSMLEMFRKLELGVDRDGNVSMPQMHVGTGMSERIVAELQNVPAELTAEIEQVKAEKIQQALDREAERKAKFKQAGK